MPQELHDLVLSHSDVVEPDAAVCATRSQDVVIPRQGRNLSLMAGHGSEFLSCFHIPNFNVAIPVSDSKKSSIRGEVNCADIGSLRSGSEQVDITRLSIPNVGALAQSDGKLIQTRPRDKIQVEVVYHAWRIQHALGTGRDDTGLVCDCAGGGVRASWSLVQWPSQLALEGQSRVGGWLRSLLMEAENSLVDIDAEVFGEPSCVRWRGVLNVLRGKCCADVGCWDHAVVLIDASQWLERNKRKGGGENDGERAVC